MTEARRAFHLQQRGSEPLALWTSARHRQTNAARKVRGYGGDVARQSRALEAEWADGSAICGARRNRTTDRAVVVAAPLKQQKTGAKDLAPLKLLRPEPVASATKADSAIELQCGHRVIVRRDFDDALLRRVLDVLEDGR